MKKAPSKPALIVGGTIMMFFMGIFYAWSRYRIILHEIFPDWTYANMSLNFSLYICVNCVGIMTGSVLIGKFGYRRILRVGAVMAGVGLLLFSCIEFLPSGPALILMYVTYGFITSLGCGFAYNGIVSGTGAYFPKRAGTVTGLLLMGYGMSSITLGNFIVYVSEKIGFFVTFRIVAVVLFAVIFSLAGLYQGGEKQGQAENTGAEGLTTAETVRTPAFWLLVLWMIFLSCQGLMVMNSAADIAQGFGVAASLGLIVSMFNGISRIGMGVVFDMTDKAPVIDTVLALVGGISLFFASRTESVALMFFGLIITGIAYGGGISLNASLTRRMFGSKHYSRNFGVANISGIVASFVGPYIAGILQDSSGGEYESSYVAMIIFGVVSLVLCILMRIFAKKLPTGTAGKAL